MGKTIMVSERSQHQGDRYHTVSHTGESGRQISPCLSHGRCRETGITLSLTWEMQG